MKFSNLKPKWILHSYQFSDIKLYIDICSNLNTLTFYLNHIGSLVVRQQQRAEPPCIFLSAYKLMPSPNTIIWGVNVYEATTFLSFTLFVCFILQVTNILKSIWCVLMFTTMNFSTTPTVHVFCSFFWKLRALTFSDLENPLWM